MFGMSKVTKTAKFFFVTLPGRVAGVDQLRGGNKLVADLWHTLTWPKCPDCDRGVMVPAADEAEAGWRCRGCGFRIIGIATAAEVNDHIRERRNARVKAILGDAGAAEREDIARRHVWTSRCFFVGTAFTAAGFLYFLASGSPILMALNWLAIGLVFFVNAMKRSYRAWQVRQGQVFIPGAFWVWFKGERWIV